MTLPRTPQQSHTWRDTQSGALIPYITAITIVWAPIGLAALAAHIGPYLTALAIGAICAALTWHASSPMPIDEPRPDGPWPGPKPDRPGGDA